MYNISLNTPERICESFDSVVVAAVALITVIDAAGDTTATLAALKAAINTAVDGTVYA
jgi:hypothetical protein